VRAEKALADLALEGDEALGADIVRNAITAPLRQIALNAGLDGSVVLSRVREKGGDFGFNAATEEYTDLVKDGIIDPTKVVRSALQNAASVAGLLITTECAIVDKPDKPAAGGGGPPGMGGMGDMGGMGGMPGMGGMGGMDF
jgi:chaperonin GroEL